MAHLAAAAHVRIGLPHGLQLLLRRPCRPQEPGGGAHLRGQLGHVRQQGQQLGDGAEAAERLSETCR